MDRATDVVDARGARGSRARRSRPVASRIPCTRQTRGVRSAGVARRVRDPGGRNRVARIQALEAHDMVRSIRGIALLDGIRGAPRVNFAALTDVLLRVSQLVSDHPEITELDVNPVLAFSNGVLAVDARVVLAATIG